METYPFRVIAHIHSDFSDKFGIPRQSGLVDALEADILFTPPYRNRDALRGLEGFSHIWLLWIFHRALRDNAAPETNAPGPDTAPDAKAYSTDTAPDAKAPGPDTAPAVPRWSPTVRPPRLGGNRRVGVFATRSPFRPNPIGLSAVRLAGIDPDSPDGPVLHVRGADLADGTPILDIKPYLPYADALPHAVGGFAAAPPEPALYVEFPPDLLRLIPENRRAALTGVLEQDPRPRYQADPARVYGIRFAGRDVRFTVDGQRLIVREVL